MSRKMFIALLGITLVMTPVPAMAEPAEQITNGGFDAGTAPWWWTGNAPAAVVDGRLCAGSCPAEWCKRRLRVIQCGL